MKLFIFVGLLASVMLFKKRERKVYEFVVYLAYLNNEFFDNMDINMIANLYLGLNKAIFCSTADAIEHTKHHHKVVFVRSSTANLMGNPLEDCGHKDSEKDQDNYYRFKTKISSKKDGCDDYHVIKEFTYAKEPLLFCCERQGMHPPKEVKAIQ
jgi:hypothetical protein